MKDEYNRMENLINDVHENSLFCLFINLIIFIIKFKQTEQVTLMKYELKKGNVLKDGHTMFIEDVVKDLNYLNNKKIKGGEKYGR